MKSRTIWFKIRNCSFGKTVTSVSKKLNAIWRVRGSSSFGAPFLLFCYQVNYLLPHSPLKQRDFSSRYGIYFTVWSLARRSNGEKPHSLGGSPATRPVNVRTLNKNSYRGSCAHNYHSQCMLITLHFIIANVSSTTPPMLICTSSSESVSSVT